VNIDGHLIDVGMFVRGGSNGLHDGRVQADCGKAEFNIDFSRATRQSNFFDLAGRGQ